MFDARKLLLTLAGIALAGVALAGSGKAQGNQATMFERLEKGEWTIRFRDGKPTRKLCLRSGGELVQLQHAGQTCSRFLVEDADDEVTIQYTCRGDGFGRTNIRRETASLVQLESQGIAGGVPFEFQAEARRTGRCR